MYQLGTTQGVLLGVYSRNQFEPLPEPLLAINQVNKDTEIPLRTAANKQSQGLSQVQGKVKARSRQGQVKVKAGSRQG